MKARRIAATRAENLASVVEGGVRGPMLAGGVVCLNDSSSAMGVRLRKSGVERCIWMMERTCTTSVVVLGNGVPAGTEAQLNMHHIT